MKLPTLPDKVYEVLKWLCLIAMPAFALFIPKLFAIWDIPLGPEIAETIELVAWLIGVLIGVSTIAYNRKAKPS